MVKIILKSRCFLRSNLVINNSSRGRNSLGESILVACLVFIMLKLCYIILVIRLREHSINLGPGFGNGSSETNRLFPD